MIAEYSHDSKICLIDIEEKVKTKEKTYNFGGNFIVHNICNQWAVFRSNKLTKLELINDNNSYDIIADNKETLIIETDSKIANLFDEFFIVCNNDGIINCYGYF